MAGSSLADIFNYSQQVPNWAPNERFLPNADYGRVGAIKLAENVFDARITQYISASGPTEWAYLGRYHYYLLSKDYPTRRNEHIRAGLGTAPDANTYHYSDMDLAIERDGPFHFKKVLSDIAETARIYGFPVQTLLSAVLTLAEGNISAHPTTSTVYLGPYASGAFAAKYNFNLLEQLWGIGRSGYPSTYSRGVAARKDYGAKSGKRMKGRKGKKGGRRKKSRYY